MKTATATKSIRHITFIREVDTDPDLSFLGEYSRDGIAGPIESIDRQERGDAGRGEFRYFTPAMSGEESGNPDSPEQDYQRCEAYNRGAWCMYGISARAELLINGTLQHVRSGGLWGIESDSEKGYFELVALEQLAELQDTLKALGFSKLQIAKACHKTATPVEFQDR